MEKLAHTLRFNGSVWCNMDIALRNIEQEFLREIRQYDLTVIELYIIRALFDRDGQYASELAHAVGRAATSFTPNLDKLQRKGMVERKSDARDRRAVRIHLTEDARNRRDELLGLAARIDARIASVFTKSEFENFMKVLSTLQVINLD